MIPGQKHKQIFFLLFTLMLSSLVNAMPFLDIPHENELVHEVILRGHPTTKSQMGRSLVVTYALWEGDRIWNCSGIFIDRTVMLTAAHCLKGHASQIIVKGFSPDGEEFDQDFIEDDFKIVKHPQYRANKVSTPDLAVVMFKRPVLSEGINFPAITNQGRRSFRSRGEEIILFGRGRENRNYTDEINWTTSRVAGLLGRNELQVQTPQGSAICGGDSGGGAIALTENRPLLMGLVVRSDGKNCGRNVDLTLTTGDHAVWIFEIVLEGID